MTPSIWKLLVLAASKQLDLGLEFLGLKLHDCRVVDNCVVYIAGDAGAPAQGCLSVFCVDLAFLCTRQLFLLKMKPSTHSPEVARTSPVGLESSKICCSKTLLLLGCAATPLC